MSRFILIFALFLIPVRVLACSCFPPGTVEEMFAEADAVYVLTLIEVMAIPEEYPDFNGSAAMIRGTGKVNEILKGTPQFESIESLLLRGPYDEVQPHSSCGGGTPLMPYDTFIVFETNGEQPRASFCGRNVMHYSKPRRDNPDLLHQLRQF